MTLAHTITPERAAFLAERRRGIGGSDVAALCGLDRHKTPVQLWQEKVGITQDEAGNPAAMRRGNFLEAAVVGRYRDMIRTQSVEVQVHHEHGDGGWQRGNQDVRVIDAEGRRRCVEIKTVRRSVWRSEWGDPWSDQVPDRALCQGLWYGRLDNADVIDFACVVIPDDPDRVIGCTADEIVAQSDLHIYQAARNRDVEASLVAAAEVFWRENVLRRVPPPPLTADDVDLLWPMHRAGEVRVVDGELMQLLRQYEVASQVANDAKKARDELRDRLVVLAGAAEAFVGADGKTPLLTVKTQQRAAYQVAASSFRTLRFTKWWNRQHEPPQQQESA